MRKKSAIHDIGTDDSILNQSKIDAPSPEHRPKHLSVGIYEIHKLLALDESLSDPWAWLTLSVKKIPHWTEEQRIKHARQLKAINTSNAGGCAANTFELVNCFARHAIDDEEIPELIYGLTIKQYKAAGSILEAAFAIETIGQWLEMLSSCVLLIHKLPWNLAKSSTNRLRRILNDTAPEKILEAIRQLFKKLDKGQGHIDQLALFGISPAFDEDAIKSQSEALARAAMLLNQNRFHKKQPTLRKAMRALGLHVDNPSDMQRAMHERYWMRILKRKQYEAIENLSISIALTSFDYISVDGRRKAAAQWARQKAWSQCNQLISLDGHSTLSGESLLDPDSIARKNYAETLSILNSVITNAFAQGIRVVSATVTAPSAYHSTIGGSQNRGGARRNPKYNGSTPNHTNRIVFSRPFGKFLKALNKKPALKRALIAWDNFAQPHRDGTPHHHYIFFVMPEFEAELLALFQKIMRPDISLAPKKKQQQVGKEQQHVGIRIEKHLTPDEAMNVAAYFSRGLYTPTRKPYRKEKLSNGIIPHAGTPEPSKIPHDFVADATKPDDRDIRTWSSRHRIRLHTSSKRNVTLYRMLRVQHLPLVNTEVKEAANYARSKKFSEFHSLMKHQPIAPYYEESINVYDEKTNRLRGYVTTDGEVALKPRWKMHFTPSTRQSTTTPSLPKNRRNPLNKNKKESYIKESRQSQNSGANEIKIAIDWPDLRAQKTPDGYYCTP